MAVRSLGFPGQLNQDNERIRTEAQKRQKPRRNQNSFLDRGGLLMKAANARGSEATDAFGRCNAGLASVPDEVRK